MWMRWNDSTHIFEQSFNDGASWAVLPLNASVINEGAINIARLPANLAVKDANNNFTSGQTINGALVINGTALNLTSGLSAGVIANIVNTVAGANNYAELALGIDVQSRALILQSYSSTFGTSGPYVANSSAISSQGINGLLLTTIGAAPLKFGSNTAERMRITVNGEICINALSSPLVCKLHIVFDGTISGGESIQQTNSIASLASFVTFINYIGATQGAIAGGSVSTVLYNTSSDNRLKDDDGRVEDVSALRRIIIHDFRWKIDGEKDRGIFAQEAHDLYPRAITKGKDDLTEEGHLIHPWMTDYSKFIPDLIAGWQEHDREIAELKRLINDKSLS